MFATSAPVITDFQKAVEEDGNGVFSLIAYGAVKEEFTLDNLVCEFLDLHSLFIPVLTYISSRFITGIIPGVRSSCTLVGLCSTRSVLRNFSGYQIKLL